MFSENYRANNYRILSASLEELHKPLDDWKEFFREREYLLKSVVITKEKILLEHLVNVCSEIIILDHSGNETEKIPLSKYSNLVGISARRTEKEFFYGIESFTFPKITYRFNPEKNNYEEYQRTDNPVDPADYVVKQEWYKSKDGTNVPVFIYHKKGIILNSKNPTILYGYGGFAKNQTPWFSRNWVPWIECGGIFAVANIRGGGEFGEEWHKNGIKENKQNSFDDFISAAEYLIAQNYTDANHLGIMGGSNGGLLVSAVAVERPDLFNAVCPRVPIIDMVRFSKFGVAVNWIHEYGNPDVKSDLENILKWSPYHNVKNGTEYPNFLFTTANNDTRVTPMHARKTASFLQSVNKENKIFLFTETEAGHGRGKPISKIVEVESLVLAFFSLELGLRV